MAQIPVPNFGNAVADPAPGVQVAPADVSSGITAAGNDLMALGAQINHQQNNAKASLALATATNQAHDAHLDVTQRMISGQIQPDQAQAELRQRLSEIQAANSQGMPPVQSAMIKTSLEGTTGELQRQMNGAVFKYKESQTAATIDATGVQLQQDAIRRGPAAAADTYDAVMDFTGGSAGFTPEQQAAKKIAFRQATTHGYYDDKSTALYAAGDQKGIADMLTTVASGKLPDGEQLSPEQRAHLTTKLVGFNSKLLADQARAQNDADRERVARENTAADALNGAQKIILNGQFLDGPTMENLATVTTGTTLEQKTRELLAAQPHIVAFASQTAPQRAALLQHYESEAANPNVGTSPDAVRQLTALQAIDAKANEMAKDDPWKAAQTYGVVVNAPPMDFSHPDGVAQQLDTRMQKIAAVEAWVGHKVSPLQPAEAEQLGHTLKGMPPDRAAGLLSMVGQSISDPDRIAAVSKQLGKAAGDDASFTDTLGLAMSYAGDRTNDGKLTAEGILRGTQALRDKTVQADETKLSGWRASVATEIRGAFSSQGAEDSAINAAYKLMAAGYSQKDAVRAATGGIITHGLGKIPLPVNMDEDTFNKRLSAVTPAMLAPQAADGNAYVGGVPMPLAKFTASLPDATLVHAGQGLYAVKAGTSFVTNRDGQRLVLRITQ
jgi:hypothetical protein